jgi:hypothetical protein
MYLAPRLTQSSNGSKWASTWRMLPRSSIRCTQTDFQADCTFGAEPCTYLASRLSFSPNGLKELPLDPCHVGVPPGVSKMITKPMVHLAETMHQSCVEINTISKCTQITLEFHQVRPWRFPYMWYIRCKPCTYLLPRLTLSQNGPKWAFTWPTSPRSSIGCAQNDL